MNEQIRYISDLAKQYKIYTEQPNELYAAINALPETAVNAIYKEYGDAERFQPVNLLRAETARQLLDGVQISKEKVEEIKEKIRTRDLNYFAHLPPEFLAQIENYKEHKKDLFASWQRDWSVFHTFFYRGKVKETVQIYLGQIGKRLLQDLELHDYAEHWVDFQGANNFGAFTCWMVLYPQNKGSHKKAHQFLLNFRPELEVGREGGSEVENYERQTKPVETYEQVLDVLRSVKMEVFDLNAQIRNYFKFAPGEQAKHWEKFKQEGIAALSYQNSLKVADISGINSREELNLAAGLPGESQSNETWNLWLFKTANTSDVLFASRGVMTCLGIGLIESEYFYDNEADNYQHRRKVNWITDKVYQYTANSLKGYKTLFRPDTFSPTLVYKFILNEYVRLFPDLKAVFDQHNLKYSEPDDEPIISPSVTDPEAVETKEINYWWLNANPKIWSISDFAEGERQTYTSRNEKGNKRRVYKYFEEVQPGDVMIGYESSPTKQIKGILEVTKPLHQSAEEGEVIEFELTEKLDIPVFWNDLENNAGLKTCEPFINNQGSLFKLTEDEFDIIREVIDAKNISHAPEVKPYSFTEDTDKPFIAEKDFRQAVELLRRKKNIILQGPPGVGKTFIARKIAYQLMGLKNDAQIEMVQFHQSYSYEDFVQGLRPSKNGFELKNGVFYSFCQQALLHPEREFFLIIDEINRGNLSKVFGELMMLIEADKRNPKFAVKMTYSDDEEARFFVPPNLYIIGTMNTADRSLAMVDYALRRRFAFITLHPEFDDKFTGFLTEKGVSKTTIEFICNAVRKVNQEIVNDLNLGTGFQIGHSYFCSVNEEKDEKDWINEIVTFEIKPLLEEIWFDDQTKVEQMLKILSF